MTGPEWQTVGILSLIFGVLIWPTVLLWIQWRERPVKHRHDWRWVGHGGAGWSVYECACGAKEIDA